MNTIANKEVVVFENTIKKSKFITYVKYIENEDDAKNFIQNIKDKHHDATHNCSAYVLGDIIRKDDDGEPSGTAGQPIADVLLYKNISNVCIVVTRYFGGIKLGAGGLVRAYSSSASLAIDQTKIVPIVTGYITEIKFNFKQSKQVDYYLEKNKITILKKEFESKITYQILLNESNYKEVVTNLKSINHLIEFKILKETMVRGYE